MRHPAAVLALVVVGGPPLATGAARLVSDPKQATGGLPLPQSPQGFACLSFILDVG